MASSLPLPSQSHTASEPVQLLVLPTNDTYIEIYKECSIGLSSFAVSSKHPANHSFDCVDPWLVPWVAPCGLAALSNCLFEILLCFAMLPCPLPDPPWVDTCHLPVAQQPSFHLRWQVSVSSRNNLGLSSSGTASSQLNSR